MREISATGAWIENQIFLKFHQQAYFHKFCFLITPVSLVRLPKSKITFFVKAFLQAHFFPELKISEVFGFEFRSLSIEFVHYDAIIIARYLHICTMTPRFMLH